MRMRQGLISLPAGISIRGFLRHDGKPPIHCAVARGAKPDEDGNFTMGEIEAVGLPFLGGCQVCHASIACYNAFPSKTNYLRCRSCIGDLGFATTDDFEESCKQFDQELPPDDDDDDDGPCRDCGCNDCDCDKYALILGDELEMAEREDIQRSIDQGY
jgi:hypothetical protein